MWKAAAQRNAHDGSAAQGRLSPCCASRALPPAPLIVLRREGGAWRAYCDHARGEALSAISTLCEPTTRVRPSEAKLFTPKVSCHAGSTRTPRGAQGQCFKRAACLWMAPDSSLSRCSMRRPDSFAGRLASISTTLPVASNNLVTSPCTIHLQPIPRVHILALSGRKGRQQGY